MRLEKRADVADLAWSSLSARTQTLLKPMFDPVVKALLFTGAVRFAEPIEGTSGFQQRFARSGPSDAMGRSLRELDLQDRLFRYPLSYLVGSEAYANLPRFAREYIDARLEAVLGGQDADPAWASVPAADKAAALEIWRAMKARRS